MRRSTYLAGRTLAAVLTVYVAVTINFLLFRILPGSALISLSQVPNATPALKHALARQFGLDQSEWTQYVKYLVQLLHLNLGVSFTNQEPVAHNLILDLGNTVPMVGLGIVFAILFGTLVGVLSAWRRGTLSEHMLVTPALGFYSMPTQWLALILILLFGSILPTVGRTNEFLIDPSFLQHQLDVLKHMVLPSATIGLVVYGQYTLIVRNSMLESLGEDYVLTGRAIGYRRGWILRRIALRNAMLPLVSVIALSTGFIVGGAILCETVFNWPGIGYAVYQSITERDYPMLEGAFLMLTVSVVLCNFIADLVHFKLDPRVGAA